MGYRTEVSGRARDVRASTPFYKLLVVQGSRGAPLVPVANSRDSALGAKSAKAWRSLPQ
jgi:hypothetical protein